jgi:hypothetical protein
MNIKSIVGYGRGAREPISETANRLAIGTQKGHMPGICQERQVSEELSPCLPFKYLSDRGLDIYGAAPRWWTLRPNWIWCLECPKQCSMILLLLDAAGEISAK